MSRLATAAMWITAVLLITPYLFPLWEIRLEAPQYPQGLGINIWINQITGAEPHDLQNINGLNHYIGMKVIEPDAIPELQYMKWILGALIALAALVALLRKRWLMVTWVVLAIVLSAAGMYDFYKWEYDYGHNLDPNAAIKIEGMSYQPPLFGTKQLLNFTTTAWPGPGGIAAMLAVALASLAVLYEFVSRRRPRGGKTATTRLKTASALGALVTVASLTLVSCSGGPQPIEYGTDACDYCLMSIADNRYGAEIVTTKGRAIKYDSIECMVNAVLEGEKVAEGDVRGYYVTDFKGRVLGDATTATYLHSESLPSPMGMNLTAFSDGSAAEEARSSHEGELLDWRGAWDLVAERSHAGHAH